jgi:hypothetical protein
MSWREELHPRNASGEFTHSSVGSWARKAADELGDMHARAFGAHLRSQHDQGVLPPGHAAAQDRLKGLFHLQPGEMSSAQRMERYDLEDAFKAYRGHLGLQPSAVHKGLHEDEEGNLHDMFGNHVAHTSDLRYAVGNRVPEAFTRGYRRVGDHPDAVGAPGGNSPGAFQQSSHPLAGGLWVDPANPGTRARPRYLNDMGVPTAAARRPRSASEQRREQLQARRRGELRGRPAETDLQWVARDVATADTYAGRTGSFGYGARGEEAQAGAAEAFVAHMKRAQPRARQEAARQAARRTPRGTRVSGWMDQAGARIAQTRGQ